MRKETVVVATLATAATVVAVAVLLRRWKKQSDRKCLQTQRILRKFARECAAPVPNLWLVANDLVSNMQSGLSSQSHFQSNLKMLPSYTSSLPTGDEKGLYYGVNLREENFLILRARLGGRSESISELEREEVPIPSNLSTAVTATSKELFDYIAAKLAISISTVGDKDPDTLRVLGFTVSFPLLECPSVSSSNALKGKSYSANDPAGKELITEFNRSLEEHGVNVHVVAVVDETVGDLAGGRYYNTETSVAAVSLGLATNASYVESAQSVTKWNGPSPKSGEMVIDMQWGSFNSPRLPITEFDVRLDIESSNPGCRIFEKLVSGMYLGEIVRRVLLKMAQETALFGDIVPPKLATPYLLRSPDMAAMHQDTSEDRETVDEKLRDIFEITNSTPMAREVVAEVCDIVAERGARLAAAGIVGIIRKLGRITNKKSVVTVEGGLYEHYRVFRNYLHSGVWEMLGNDLSDNVIIEPSHGGSGAGSIFLAASQSTEDRES